MLLQIASVCLLWVSAAVSQTVYLAGDSTMAKGGGGAGTDGEVFLLYSVDSSHRFIGWGQYLGQYLTIPVVNMAIAGRSARSYTDEGRFTTLINTAKQGDFVIIEFGHNDGTATVDNGREDAVGNDILMFGGMKFLLILPQPRRWLRHNCNCD